MSKAFKEIKNGTVLWREHDSEYDYYGTDYLVVYGLNNEILLVDTDDWRVEMTFKTVEELIVFMKNDKHFNWEIENYK